MQKLCRLRHGVIKRYFEKNKYKKNSRNEIIEAAEESEIAIQEVMRDDHVHFLDANPEIRTFMEQVNKDETTKVDAVIEKGGRKQGDLPDIKRIKQIDQPKDKKKKKKEISYVDAKLKNLKAFESPSSDSDSKTPLSKRSFKFSYEKLGILHEQGVEIKNTSDDTATSQSDN